MNNTIKTDVLIAGCGCSGLYMAMNLPADKKILMITKSDCESSDSYLAQGGMCMLKCEEDYDSYFEDTMKAGHYENDKKSVEIMIRSSAEVVKDLVDCGARFAREADGSLAYTREITDGKNAYRMLVENGKVVKASSKDRAGKWVDVAENQFEGFIKNHAKQVKEAETLQKTLHGKDVQILNKKGKLVKQRGSVQLNVRNGEVISAKFNGRDLKPEELKALGKDFKTEIGQFGHEAGSRYGLSNYEYVYRQKGGQTIRFDNSRRITNVTAVTQKDITKSDAIKNFLEKNDGIKSELENIASTGSISNGYRLGNMVYRDDAGRTFEIAGDKIKGLKLNKKITLCGKTFKAGDLIDGKYLGEWRKTAENGNAYDAVAAML